MEISTKIRLRSHAAHQWPQLLSNPVFQWCSRLGCLFLPVLIASLPSIAAITHVPDMNENIMQARSFVLNGKITGENNEPLPGASVRIKGTNKGATTDVNGKFILEVSSEADSLVISFVGYKTKVMAAGRNRDITVNLEPDEEGRKLNEVAVVGFGTQKKSTMVGSVSTVDVKEIQKFSTPSLSNAIGGKLPGVITRQTSGEPGYDAARVYIRGVVSQAGDRRPLIIVDGAERELQDYWTTMNIQEIASFTVLKDATATAVYGSRGANGVILITTRRGSVGAPRVTFRSEMAVVTPMRIEKNINSYDFALLHNEALANVNLPARYTAAELQKYRDHSDPYLYPDVNWYDVVFRKHTRQSINNLGVTGGTENVKYYINLGYSLQEGIYNDDPANSYKTNAVLKRYNFRSNVDVKISKSFSLELGLSGIISGTNFPGTDMGRIFDVLKLTPPNAYPIKNPDGSNPGATGDSEINPYAVITQTGYTRQFYNTLVSNLAARWDLSAVTPGLSARGLAAFDVVDITQNVRRKTPATFFYQKDPATGEETYKPIVNESALGFYNANENYRTIYGEAGFNYDRTFGRHNVSGLLLGTKREFINVNAGNSVENLPERRQGLVTRLNYGYDRRYLLELNAGYSGSENFPKGKRYGFFPSVGLGWIISNEKFWNRNVVSTLKLSGSYGKAGNDRIGGARFLFLSTYNKSAGGYTYGSDLNVGIGGVSEARIGNMDVTWETAYKTNLRLDLELFDGKVSTYAEVFHERREGQLFARKIIPIYTGYPSSAIPYANVGISTNKGLEGSLQFRNQTKSGFYYSFLGNFTLVKNKVIEDDSPRPPYPWQELRGNVIDATLGYKAIGLFRDQDDIARSPVQELGPYGPGDIKYADINGDGRINNADRTIIGNYGVEPQLMYGFGATVSWKGFDASVFFTGAGRRDFFFTLGSAWTMWPFSDGVGRYNVMQEYYDNRWVPGADNSNARYPAVRASSLNNYTLSSLWYRNGAYLRIKNAEIGYSLPEALVKRIRIRALRVFVQGTNLVTWDHIKVIDPESNWGTGRYPNTRNLNFGLEVSF